VETLKTISGTLQRNKYKDYMKTRVKVTAVYNCSLERAFKTPMLCDVSKVHTGFGIMPKVTHCEDDGDWGQPGSTKKVFVAKSLTQKGGFASTDKVIERVENKYWKIEVSDFQSWMLGFCKFTGEWQTTETEDRKILIEYTYTLYSNITLLYPVNWLFAKLFWKAYMKRVLENIRQMTNNREPYLYN
jgi:Polyketide cyclase / dehydrase and lipid transport